MFSIAYHVVSQKATSGFALHPKNVKQLSETSGDMRMVREP
jgi:hypothetical protein